MKRDLAILFDVKVYVGDDCVTAFSWATMARNCGESIRNKVIRAGFSRFARIEYSFERACDKQRVSGEIFSR